jgi:hypothetical protein
VAPYSAIALDTSTSWPFGIELVTRVKYCTLFDRRYLARGLVMLESLSRFLSPGDEIFVLAMDDETAGVLKRISAPAWTIVPLQEFEDPEVLALRGIREFREFCWTCTPALSAWITGTSLDGETVVYVDSDLMFYRDPRELICELDDDGSILVHEHRYASDKGQHESGNGRFNVGLVGFRVGDEARACVDRWRQQVIERCELDPENGYCGDQGYLNEWPAKYRGLRVLRNIGGGVAPWNVGQYTVGQVNASPTVDGTPVVFFHFHSLEMAIVNGFGLIAVNPAKGYRLSHRTRRIVYRDYARRLRRAVSMISKFACVPRSELSWNYLDILKGALRGRYVSAI